MFLKKLLCSKNIVSIGSLQFRKQNTFQIGKIEIACNLHALLNLQVSKGFVKLAPEVEAVVHIKRYKGKQKIWLRERG
jgi:hypothetical protein